LATGSRLLAIGFWQLAFGFTLPSSVFRLPSFASCKLLIASCIIFNHSIKFLVTLLLIYKQSGFFSSVCSIKHCVLFIFYIFEPNLLSENYLKDN